MSSTGMHVPSKNDGPFTRRVPSGRGWRASLVAGIAVAGAGLACMIWPGHSVSALVRIIALAMLVSALGSIVTGLRSRGRVGSGTMIFSGVLLLLAAIFMLWHPGLTGELIVLVMGGAILASGLAAGALGTVLHGSFGSTRWLQINGLVGAVVGLVLLIHPQFGTTAVGIIIGAVLALLGAALIALALRLRGYITRFRAASVQHEAMATRLTTDRARHREDGGEDVVIEGDVID
ncbi:HdeD family acid-resistance protein [Propionibacterium australiense]|uniref:Acid-resistance membrane protein n=1 Tax=Propionibacterium australiense TaxID=119981 RepID=A0A383S2H6_9ACTN|nr:DUF308 domain-containing protein [Propionibacterium australiense]RLP11494.1 hypothetical protein D9T14_02445 [Propionibacterium australiense]RLP12770.1 hypothetical protein D7U36_01955 [Propionibacterium australiense]SYZ32195.1 Protein of unknown function DUF308, membrane [Propionibacterium australiense]VEH90705.1 Uncharacterized conserved protein [Propionibacterium australiense]